MERDFGLTFVQLFSDTRNKQSKYPVFDERIFSSGKTAKDMQLVHEKKMSLQKQRMDFYLGGVRKKTTVVLVSGCRFGEGHCVKSNH